MVIIIIIIKGSPILSASEINISAGADAGRGITHYALYKFTTYLLNLLLSVILSVTYS